MGFFPKLGAPFERAADGKPDDPCIEVTIQRRCGHQTKVACGRRGTLGPCEDADLRGGVGGWVGGVGWGGVGW